jgi:hypothetical protein
MTVSMAYSSRRDKGVPSPPVTRVPPNTNSPAQVRPARCSRIRLRFLGLVEPRVGIAHLQTRLLVFGRLRFADSTLAREVPGIAHPQTFAISPDSKVLGIITKLEPGIVWRVQ